MASGLQLKNTLTSKDPTVKAAQQHQWLQSPPDFRQSIKELVSRHGYAGTEFKNKQGSSK